MTTVKGSCKEVTSKWSNKKVWDSVEGNVCKGKERGVAGKRRGRE